MNDMAQKRTMQAQNDTFADRLKNLRAQAGLSQDELADRAEISKTILSRYERGVSEPKRSTMLKLAEALDCSTELLSGMGLEDAMRVPVALQVPKRLYDRIKREADQQEVSVETKIFGLIDAAYTARDEQAESIAQARTVIEGALTVMEVLKEIEKDHPGSIKTARERQESNR